MSASLTKPTKYIIELNRKDFNANFNIDVVVSHFYGTEAYQSYCVELDFGHCTFMGQYGSLVVVYLRLLGYTSTMILDNLQDRIPGDTIYLCGTGYKILQVVNDIAYTTRLGTAGTKTYVIRKEGLYHTASVLKGDRTESWSHCGVLHYLQPINLFPGLDT